MELNFGQKSLCLLSLFVFEFDLFSLRLANLSARTGLVRYRTNPTDRTSPLSIFLIKLFLSVVFQVVAYSPPSRQLSIGIRVKTLFSIA